ncbi:MAG: hypothetical protein ACRC80_16375 [Waterburya sp.]
MKFDKRKDRYVDSSGNVVTPNRLRAIQRDHYHKFTDYLDQVDKTKVKKLTKDFIVGNLLVHFGGKNNTPSEAYLIAANLLKQEIYPALDKVYAQYRDGTISEAMLLYWQKRIAKKYVRLESLTKIYKLNGRFKPDQSQYAFRTLAISHIHCAPCIEYSKLGVKKATEIPLPQIACTCGDNCLCLYNIYPTLKQAIQAYSIKKPPKVKEEN